jgi:predicted dithiol-disulfide oxidoreductase (DUF899 family)
MPATPPANPTTVSPEKWRAARLKLLAVEKQHTRAADKLADLRRRLPWVRIAKDYRFAAPGRRRVTLADLFGDCSQLIVQHFMLGPGWEEGCKSCSFMMDHIVPTVPHLAARDVAFAAISHAPLSEIRSFQRRMGWRVNWVSAYGTDFNQDFRVSFSEEQMAGGTVEYNYTKMSFPHEEAPGISVFARDAAGAVYHTYSTYGRGVEVVMGTYHLLDLVPKGRDEDKLEYGMEWVRHHDRYESATKRPHSR